MILLLGFAFLAGIVTILSPCILPILPIVLSSSIGDKKTNLSRPIGVVVGFIASFTFFTLFLSTIVQLSGIPANALRVLSVVIIALLGVSMLIPKFQLLTEQLFSRLAALMPRTQAQPGFVAGIVVGLSLGLLWTPCVGPILASVISLAITGTVTLNTFFITFAYALGTAIPMFLIIVGGRSLLNKVPWLLANTGKIQKAFGVIMMLTAVAIFTNVDRRFQTFVLNTFPQYGVGLTKFEDNAIVQKQLEALSGSEQSVSDVGKPMFDLLDPKGIRAAEIIAGGEWFNSKPLTLESLRGKVVVIDFWTYSCINCQRTLPYLRDWWTKYKDKGLVIIGVHAPEFEFEKDATNVKKAIADFKLTYPVVQDNNFATWRAYNNHYWPAKYFIDKEGYIRHTHFGEGEYDQSERVIQELLQEAGATDVTSRVSNPEYQTYGRTPETYLGYGRIEYLASPEQISRDQVAQYTSPEQIPDDHFGYEGNFTISSEYATPQKNANLFVNFEAKEVYLVMNPVSGTAKVRVYVDGRQQFLGEDVKDGVVTVDTDRLYKLVKLVTPGRHLLRLEFLDNNAEIFAFTFG